MLREASVYTQYHLIPLFGPPTVQSTQNNRHQQILQILFNFILGLRLFHCYQDWLDRIHKKT